MTTQLLRIENLTITDRDGNVLVRCLDLEVAAGEMVCIVGETGSGKSLVAQCLMGLLPRGLSADGTVTFGGRPPIPVRDSRRLKALWNDVTGYMPQEPGAAFDPLTRVRHQMTRAGESNTDLTAAMASVDLPVATLEQYPFELSGGMAQRVILANAGLSPASLVIVDEPTKGLDGARVGHAVALLRTLQERGKALLVVTHDPAVVRGLDGAVVVMKGGEIVDRGVSRDILKNPKHAYTREWISADPINWPRCDTCLQDDDVVLAGHNLKFGFRNAAPMFEGLDVHLHRGEVLAVTGPSGCGKTTLGNVLLGLLPPAVGEVSWRGCDPYLDEAGRRRLRQRYQKLHQDPSGVFVPHRRIGAQLQDLITLNLRSGAQVDLDETLDRLRLKRTILERKVGEISGGEAQRLALARLLLLDPWLIVADEPTSRLDPIVQRDTMTLLRELVRDTGMSMILISHHIDLARAVADSVLPLGSGPVTSSTGPSRLP
jgi:peptide/nickel transport system ATP-binding protein